MASNINEVSNRSLYIFALISSLVLAGAAIGLFNLPWKFERSNFSPQFLWALLIGHIVLNVIAVVVCSVIKNVYIVWWIKLILGFVSLVVVSIETVYWVKRYWNWKLTRDDAYGWVPWILLVAHIVVSFLFLGSIFIF